MRLNKLQRHLITLGLPLDCVRKTHIPDGAKIKFRLNSKTSKILRYRFWKGALVINGESEIARYYGNHPFPGISNRVIGFLCVNCGYVSSCKKFRKNFGHNARGKMAHAYCKRCKAKDKIASVRISHIVKIWRVNYCKSKVSAHNLERLRGSMSQILKDLCLLDIEPPYIEILFCLDAAKAMFSLNRYLFSKFSLRMVRWYNPKA